MLLAIDVGNTNIVFGFLEGETVMGSFRQVTDYTATAQAMAADLLTRMAEAGLSPEAVTGVIIASVVPQVIPALKELARETFHQTALVVDENVDPGLPYEAEERLGADRAVCCIAAMEKYGKPLVVLDYGTATTVDALAADGSYLGGCILAGIRTSTNALYTGTAQLPQIDLQYPPTMLGRDAVTQIQAGSVAGAVGSTEYLVRKTKEEMGYGMDVKVVATGGLAHLVAAHTDCIDIVDDDLIVDGLRLIYERYQQSGL